MCCCNNQSRSRCGCSCWGGCQNTWNQARTGSSCYVSVPQFLCAAAQAEEESSAQASHRFVVTGTIDQFRLLSGCNCGCD
ncbi:hypothetical protein B5G43_08850 [Flavonifractor sp. An92]|uniref:hypothetical protein n=1 Tax=Flavonifractor sp. An92 TaxID=1965666 RepID=UPI000B388D0F|nr:MULTISPECIES: hypothetical protein [unclassified Flavonifractor]OUN06508.1 hypothetical protein B5G43_08850 [Flavonifractor sp. An92]OUQ25189.1 hypothetical protein B5E80_05215 [Flavonifractor sp. An135]